MDKRITFQKAKVKRFIALLWLCLFVNHYVLSQPFTPIDGPYEILELGNRKYIQNEFQDFNGDRYPDLFAIRNPNKIVTYKNNGEGTFLPFDTISLEKGYSPKMHFADLNGDGYIDFLLTGSDSKKNSHTELYFNNGDGYYTKQLSDFIEDVQEASVSFFDSDGDNDLDLILSGYRSKTRDSFTGLYINDSKGLFKAFSGNNFINLNNPRNVHGDFDLDGDIDLVFTGYSNQRFKDPNIFLYENKGDNSFVQKTNIDPKAIRFNNVLLTDFDSDLDLDLIISSHADIGTEAKIHFYKNDGAWGFEEDFSNSFVKGMSYKIVSIDFDYDKDEDLFVTYIDTNQSTSTKLYINDMGDFSESDIFNIEHPLGLNPSFWFSDIDYDQDYDLLLHAGYYNNWFLQLYTNDFCKESQFVDYQTTCNPYTWIDGNTYTENNNSATYSLSNEAGCDSTITLNLTINKPSTSIDLQTTCDSSFLWKDGNTYTESNSTATYTLLNSFGCDSIVSLNLTMNRPTSSIDVQTTCNDSYEWIDGNIYTDNNNTATYTLTNAVGCDSTITLNLTINKPSTSTDTRIADNTYTWIDGNTYTENNNTATYTLTNTAGCDSTVALNLTINIILATETKQEKEILLFPNPVSDRLKIDINNESNSLANFYISSSDGKILRNWNSDAQKQTVDVSYLASGNYILRVILENEILVGRFVKNE